MVHLFAWFLAYAEQMFVSKRRHVLRRWNLSRRREYAREKKKNGREKEVPPKRKPRGKRVAYFVTGWSSGIGFETCLSLLQGHKEEEMVVELHLPTRAFPPGGVGNKGRLREGGDEDANDAGKRLRSEAKSRGLIETGEKEKKNRIVLAKIDLDCATLAIDAGARKRARKYFAENEVDVLIHCAAECNAERRVLVLEEGGVDREAMCNVLGPAVLTKLWRDEMSVNDNREDGGGGAMKKTVVFVGSFTHRARLGVCTRANAKEWINRLDRCASARKEKDFETLGVRYALSKLMVTAYALGKMREEEDRDDSFVRVKVVDPGLCRTKLTRTWPKALRLLYEIPMRTVGLLEHPRKGAERIVRAATLSEDNEKEKEWSNAVAYSHIARDELVQRLCVKAVDGFIERENARGCISY